MKWAKQGLIFRPAGEAPWMRTHATCPVALPVNDDVYRIYFASRDAANHAHIGFVVVDITRPQDILDISRDFVLGPGPAGFFDDNGVYPGCVVAADEQRLMYYAGRNEGVRPLYYMSIGLAISDDAGATYSRASRAPILGRSETDPWMVSTPFVLREGSLWRMWYLSGLGWDLRSKVPKSFYNIKYAQSTDGREWTPTGDTCIELRPGETNVGRPCVIKEAGIYRMWYSFVADNGYRIGYAESPDGHSWVRNDEAAGIDGSVGQWDSAELAYPFVLVHKSRKYMLYNGNDFGREGFGLAVED